MPQSSQVRSLAASVSGPFQIVEVLGAQAGAATRVRDPATGGCVQVTGHLDSAAALEPGDLACVAATAQGVVVLGRLRSATEAPAALPREAGGRVEIAAHHSVLIRAGASRIEIRADGSIRLDGREVHQVAEGRLSLLAATVEIN